LKEYEGGGWRRVRGQTKMEDGGWKMEKGEARIDGAAKPPDPP
jgi:hypothetical protein